MSRRSGIVAGALAAALLLGGCGPSEPFAPVAVRMDGSRVQIAYVDCHPSKVTAVKVVKLQSGQKVIHGDEPVIWQVTFAQPTSLSAVTVDGEVPAGATVAVPLQGPLDPAVRYEAFVSLQGKTDEHIGFEVGKLGGGRVSYEDKYVSQEDFAKKSACS